MASEYSIVSRKASKAQIKESVLRFFFACEFVEFLAITCAGLGQHGRQPAQGTGCLYSPKVFPKSRGEAWIGCDDVCMLHSILVQLDPARPGHEKMYLLKQIVRRVREEP